MIPQDGKLFSWICTIRKNNEKRVMPTKSSHTIFQKRLYSIKELVALIGVTEWFWRSQIWDGRLPFIQVGKKMLIDSRDLEDFIEKHKMQY